MYIRQLLITICIVCVLYFLYKTYDRYTERKQIVKHKASIKRLETKIKKKPIDYYKLGRLYHNGTSDTYVKGTLVKGIKPDPIKAIKNYNKAIEQGDLSCIFELASIYHWGMNGHNVQDIQKAQQLYIQLINQGSLIQQTKARSLLNRLQTETSQQQEYHNVEPMQPVPEQIQSSSNVQQAPSVQPTLNVQHNIPVITTNIQPNQYIGEPLPTIPRTITPLTPPPREIPFYVRPDTDDILDELMLFFTVDRYVDNNLIVDGPTINDSQNVHDTGVNSTIAMSVNNLKQNTILQRSIQQTIQDITDYINTLQSSDKTMNAKKTLQYIQTTNAHITSCNMTELEFLQLIWNRIIASSDSKTLMDNLVNQLAESVEYGEVVCTTGRYTRLIDSLNLVDPLVNIKPQWVISQEMLQRASVLFNTFMEGLSEEQKNIYNNDLDGVNDITNNAKEYIKSNLQKEYVDSNIARQDVLDAELAKWLDSIC